MHYFDALYVVIRKLIEIYTETQKPTISENIYSMAYAYVSFAKSAILVGNANGASLASIRIREVYQKLKEASLHKEAKNIISLLLKVGMLSAAHKDKLTRVDFIDQPLNTWVMDVIVKSNEDIRGEVMDSYMDTVWENHTGVWGFITELGVRMGTNFGLMFDATNGKIYSNDDPRRR